MKYTNISNVVMRAVHTYDTNHNQVSLIQYREMNALDSIDVQNAK